MPEIHQAEIKPRLVTANHAEEVQRERSCGAGSPQDGSSTPGAAGFIPGLQAGIGAWERVEGRVVLFDALVL